MSENTELKQKCVENGRIINEISELQKSYGMVKKENVKLRKSCESLESQVTILKSVAGDVMQPGNNIVVVSENDSPGCTDCHKNKIKIENLTKESSVLHDQLLEKEDKVHKLDNFYKEVVETKDKTIKECMEIKGESSELEAKFRRMLLHQRAENELKDMQRLRNIIVGSNKCTSVKDSATNTEDEKELQFVEETNNGKSAKLNTNDGVARKEDVNRNDISQMSINGESHNEKK